MLTRELKEETGATAKKIELLACTYPSPGCLREKLYLYAATGLEFSELDLDEDEFLEVLKIPFQKAIEMIKKGEIVDGKTINSILLYNEMRK